MKIAHIVSTFSPEHGGPTNEIGNYCERQAARGLEVELYTLFGFPGTSGARRVGPGVRQFSFKTLWPPSLGYSRELVRALGTREAPDIYHVHGVWHLAQLAGCREARKRGRPYLYHLMGGFTQYELNRKWLKKRAARWLYQDRLIREAACVHVNGEGEAHFLRSLGFSQPILVLPVGADLDPATVAAEGKEVAISQMARGRKILLYLARLHPTKGVELLLSAWNAINRSHPDWVLVVAGAGTPAYTDALQARSRDMLREGRVHFTGLLGEGEKQWCFRHAALYILPSLQENFGNTVVEALAHRVPVITTHQTPWSELPEQGCGWLCAASSEGIATCLDQVLRLPGPDLEAAGCRGRELVAQKYSISAAVETLTQVYHWMKSPGDLPGKSGGDSAPSAAANPRFYGK